MPGAPRAFAALGALCLAFVGGTADAQLKGDPQRGEAKAAPCAACHGPAGQSALPGMPSLAAQPETFLTLQLILMREGLRDVPAMAPFVKGLSDQEVADLAAYFARAPLVREIGARDEGLFGRGAQLSKGMRCGSCHLADYLGQNQMPRLAGQREDYLFESMKAYRDNRRTGTDTSMSGVLYGVSDADLRALAHYLARQ